MQISPKTIRSVGHSFVFIFFIFVFYLTLVATAQAATANTSYISTSGTNLSMNGAVYKFTGVNAFNLGTYPGSNAGCGGEVANLDTFFSYLRPNSIVRMWAFQGGITTNVTTKQRDWTGLDRVVNAAQKDGVKLILVLGDQAGACDDGHWRDSSWYSAGYKQAFNDYGNGLTPVPYMDYVKEVVTRYKDSPAVAMWEPLNEPEAAGCETGKGTECYAHQTCDESTASQAMRSFFDTVGTTIKGIDTKHLVISGVGGNGQCGAIYGDYQYLHQSPGIDVATYHDYDKDNDPMPGDPWNGLQERLDQTKAVNKPLVIEEAGMLAADNTTSCISLGDRRDKFKAKMDAEFSAGITGYMPWSLTGGTSNYCNFSIGDNDPLLTLLHDYPVSMGSYTDTLAPTSPTNLIATMTSPTSVSLTWTASVDNVGVVRYDIFRNNNYYTSTTTTSFNNTQLTQGAVYTYTVKGKDAANNNSGSSNKITITAK